MTTTTYAADLDDVREAAERIKPYAHRTPVLSSQLVNDRAGCEIFFKCENFQKVGAFKFRGACNAVCRLSDEVAARGVVTHSSGNHAQALALAARIRGIDAHIIMPHTASAVKRRAVEGYGGRVYTCEPTEESRQSIAHQIEQETNATMIPPFEHPDILAGQGTAALELLEEAPDLDAIVTPIGGGGLMSGTCIAAKAIKPGIRIIGAEPAGADDAARSLASGTLVPQTGPDTICDGLLTSLGPMTWAIIRDHVEAIVTPDDDATIDAMRFIWERMKIMIEPSSAVAAAVVFSEQFGSLENLRRVGVILTGGNVDLDHLPFRPTA